MIANAFRSLLYFIYSKCKTCGLQRAPVEHCVNKENHTFGECYDINKLPICTHENKNDCEMFSRGIKQFRYR